MQTFKAVLKTMSLYLQTVGRLFFFNYSLKNIYLHLKNQAQFQRSEIPKFVRYRHEPVWMVKFICMFTRPFKDKEYRSIEADGYLYL